MSWIGKTNKAIAFLRVSSHRQKDNTSHDIQEQEVRKYCEEKGLDLIEIAPIVESAKDSDNRKKYKAARRKAIRQGLRHHVYYMGDREARNLTDNEDNEKLVRQDKIVLHYARDRKVIHSKSSDSDFFTRDIFAVSNKQFSRNLSVKVNDAMKRKAEQGWYPGNHPPLGYMHKKRRDEDGRELKRGTIIVPDEYGKCVQQVQREFELRALGYSYQEIRDKIVSEGFIKPGKLSQYRANSVQKRLTHKFYRGFFDWQEIEYAGKHELIIPRKVINKVDQTFGKKQRRVTQEKGVFAGFLKCGHSDCGCNVIYDPKPKKIKATGEKKIYEYYHCTNAKRVHKKDQNISEEKLWQQFEPAVDQITVTKQRAQEIADALNEAHDKACRTVRKQIKVYKQILQDLDVKADQILDLLMENTIDKEGYNSKLKQIRKERDHYTDLLENAQLNLNGAYRETAKSILELATDAKSLWKSMEPKKRREFLKKILSNPVLNGLNVEYDLKKPFDTLSKMSGNVEWRPQGNSNPRLRRERALS